MDIFLSFAFWEQDRVLAEHLETLLRSHGVRAVTGRELDGQPVTEAVLARVEHCDGLVALMTRRDQIGNPEEDRWRTHEWVRDEINHARSLKRPAVALVENGVAIEGAYADNERIGFDREDPLCAFLALSLRVANWKRARGRSLMANIMPPALGHDVGDDPRWACQYRYWTEGVAGSWNPGNLIPAQGGTQLFLRGVLDDDSLIEVQIKRNGDVVWRSPATSPHVTIVLNTPGSAG